MAMNSNAIEKQALELQQAKHFMRWVTLREPARIIRLDQKKDRKRPEFAFYYPSGQRYTLELKRWLTPKLRELQDFLDRNIAETLSGSLLGTFVLDISLEKLKGDRISKSEAANLVRQIKQIGSSDMRAQPHQLSIGSLARVRDDGHRLVPMIRQQELLLLHPGDKEAEALRNELTKILRATNQKFRWYRGTRVLLLDISQCGLDIDYHAGYSKEGPGAIIKWLSEFSNLSTRINYVCVSQGMRVWNSVMNRILTGHKYVDTPDPNYEEVWRRSGLPDILQSSPN